MTPLESWPRHPGFSNSSWFIIRLMYELFALVEKYGIVSVGDISKIPSLADDKIEKLHHDLFKFIYDAQTERIWGASSGPAGTFSFHASASLRGASGCTSVGCRLSKLDYLSRYAALYASELTFPLSMVRPKESQDISLVREWLFHDLLALIVLRPLITENVVVPVVMRSEHCIHEAEFMEMSRELVHEFSQAGAKSLLPEFRLLYQLPEKSPSGQPTLYLSGPEDYIEHGGLAQPLVGPPDWLPKTGRYDKKGMMEVRGPHKKHMVEEMFRSMADNITFYLAYGLKRKARFLSDMRGETDFLEWINDDEDMTAKSVALEELQHSVPLLADLTLATILRIRKSEKDAFESYQNAVTKMSSDILDAKNRVSKKQARQMFRDAIEPELKRMKKELATHQKIGLRQAAGGAVIMTAGVLLGAYAGLPPIAAVPVATLGTLVGGRLLTKVAEGACEHGPEFKQKNDLYFLLKLTEEA
jgi:hypothetical protein